MPSANGGVAIPQSANVRASAALRDLHLQRRSDGSGASPVGATFNLTQRSEAPAAGSPALLDRHGLTAATSLQLPPWYLLLRQSVRDAWTVIGLVYRLANHVLGSLFEVRWLAADRAQQGKRGTLLQSEASTALRFASTPCGMYSVQVD